jgi:hypothetical protein
VGSSESKAKGSFDQKEFYFSKHYDFSQKKKKNHLYLGFAT